MSRRFDPHRDSQSCLSQEISFYSSRPRDLAKEYTTTAINIKRMSENKEELVAAVAAADCAETEQNIPTHSELIDIADTSGTLSDPTAEQLESTEDEKEKEQGQEREQEQGELSTIDLLKQIKELKEQNQKLNSLLEEKEKAQEKEKDRGFFRITPSSDVYENLKSFQVEAHLFHRPALTSCRPLCPLG
jgi:hypothetical protein